MTIDPDQIDAGFMRLLGYEIVSVSSAGAQLELALGPQHLNRAAVPHGGLHATLLDTAMGFAAGWDEAAGRLLPLVTLNLNVSYLDVPKGRRLTAIGQRVGGGRTVQFAEGLIRDETGLVLARATGTFRILKPR